MRESLIVRRWGAFKRYRRYLRYWSARGVGPFLEHLEYGLREQPQTIFGNEDLRQMVLHICFTFRPDDSSIRRRDDKRWPMWLLFVLRFGNPQVIYRADVPTVDACLQVMSQQPEQIAQLCFADEELFRQGLEVAFAGETQDAPSLSSSEQIQLEHVQTVARELLEQRKSYSLTSNWQARTFERFNRQVLHYIMPPVLQPMLRLLKVSETYLPARASDFEELLKTFARGENDDGFGKVLQARDIYYRRRYLNKTLQYVMISFIKAGFAAIVFGLVPIASYEVRLFAGRSGLLFILSAGVLAVLTVGHWIWRESKLALQVEELRDNFD